ncbi:HAD superfamily hydrolase (TIGR01458 family) [Aminobacter sp. AP02]|nr:TIGR01458 family HAD-type hydrolase [Aminobacter sp. AP02]PWK65711.1 HAD superfamily hydrolase (TIGR01458 family) [Aminobacter sp. AP02]
MIRAVLLDLSGVVYDGDTPIPGAVEAVERLRSQGLAVRFVSNTTRSPHRAIVAQLAGLGVTVGRDELFTPARAAADWLTREGCVPDLLVHPDLVPEFAGNKFGARRAVVVGDAADAFTYAAMNAAFRQLIDGAAFLALAVNRTFKDADGGLSLDAGAFVAALEFAAGKQATVLGKPSRDFFHAALSGVDCAPGQAVMVGDDAESDVAGALRAGIGSALLVRTGKYRAGDESRFAPHPTAIVNDLAAAVDWILDHRG